jgi:hypothetical protein
VFFAIKTTEGIGESLIRSYQGLRIYISEQLDEILMIGLINRDDIVFDCVLNQLCIVF